MVLTGLQSSGVPSTVRREALKLSQDLADRSGYSSTSADHDAWLFIYCPVFGSGQLLRGMLVAIEPPLTRLRRIETALPLR